MRHDATPTVPIAVFDAAYSGRKRFLGFHKKGCPPWEIGRAQPSVVQLAGAGLITGRVLDTGVLHLFSDADRARYAAGLGDMLRPGGRYHVVCFSQFKAMPARRRLTQEDIRATFWARWEVESIVETRYEVRDGSSAANAWLASVCLL